MCRNRPKIITFQMQHGEFLFLGKEYSLENPDFKKIWDDFLGTGGYEHGAYSVIGKYAVKPFKNMNIRHNNSFEHETYFIGRIVEGINEVPEGFTLMKVSASNYFVVTFEWMQDTENTKFNPYGEHGAEKCIKYLGDAKMPDGYMRYGGIGTKIKYIEVDNFHTPEGDRIEFWVPIKKEEDNTQ